jgi:hypothetical protein
MYFKQGHLKFLSDHLPGMLVGGEEWVVSDYLPVGENAAPEIECTVVDMV